MADIAMRGEMGIPGVLSAPQWGFYDVFFSRSFSSKGKELKLNQYKS
ncbi:2-methylcitrate dehydratase PrpD [Endozoicomonas sp. NE40]|uniref:2-methylcitrate dehydratase PrpD n=1 Tax=Endozoicomonas lisbonensis TaxID=3120522 RepID=A0ABV2SI04_9GAMM